MEAARNTLLLCLVPVGSLGEKPRLLGHLVIVCVTLPDINYMLSGAGLSAPKACHKLAALQIMSLMRLAGTPLRFATLSLLLPPSTACGGLELKRLNRQKAFTKPVRAFTSLRRQDLWCQS